MTDNTVTIAGNLTRDPELRFTNRGQATATFTVAVNRTRPDRQSQERKDPTSFFDVVAWGTLAENAATSLTKGTRVVVTGRLDQLSWESEGVPRPVTTPELHEAGQAPRQGSIGAEALAQAQAYGQVDNIDRGSPPGRATRFVGRSNSGSTNNGYTYFAKEATAVEQAAALLETNLRFEHIDDLERAVWDFADHLLRTGQRPRRGLHLP